MNQSRNLLISLAVVSVFAAGGFFLLAKNARLPEHALDRVPDSAVAVVWVDVQAVRSSWLYRRFVTDAGEDAALRRLAERCGFDPLDQVKNVVAFVTGAPETLDHVGFVAEGDFQHEALAACLRSAVEEDGGSLREVEIEGARAVASGNGPSRAAFIGAKGVVAGHEDLVASTVRTVRGRETSFGHEPSHRALWDRLARHREVVLYAKVPERWQDGLRDALGPERAELVAPHFTHLRALAASARVSRGLAMTVVTVMASNEAATELARKAREFLDRVRSNPLVALSPAGAFLAGLEANAEGDQVTIAFDLTQERVDRIFGFVDRIADRLSMPTPAGGGSSGATPAPAPASTPASASP